LLTPRVGPAAARRLLAALGSPQAVFGAAPDVLATLVPPREAKALQQAPEGLAAQVALTGQWLAEADPAPGAERAVITLADPRYPKALLQASDPPLVLYAQGRLALLNAPAVSMVGS